MAYTFPSDAHASGDTGHVIDHNNLVDVLTGMGAVYNVQNTAFAGGAKGDGAADDTAAISAAETAAAAAGGVLIFPPGTYKTTGLVKKSSSTWRGAGRGATIIKLANGANTPILVSDQFAALTLTSSNTAGVTGFAIRDIVFDGNASGQSVPAAAGMQIFGYDYLLDNVSVRNFLATDGLYTEWGPAGGTGLAEKAMESRLAMVRVHDNTLTGAGWHNRGPHDTHVFGMFIYSNTTSAYGYWAETTGIGYAATGLSGTAVSSTPATIPLAVTTLSLPAAGTVTAPSAGGTVTITYTGVTATSLTGCTTSGGSGNYTSNTLTAPQYTASAVLINSMHVWGSHSIAMVLDCENHVANSELEGAATGQLLVRSGNCIWDGGKIFYPTSGAGYGVQIGDTANKATAFVLNNPVLTGFTGGAAAQAAVNVVNSASGNYRATIFQSSGQAIYGTFQPYELRKFSWGGTVTPTVAAGAGAGTSPPAPTLSNASDNRGSVNMGTGTATAAGTQATVTFAQPKPGTPTVVLTPVNAATAALQPYVSNTTVTAFSVSFAVAPAVSQATGTYVIAYADVT